MACAPGLLICALGCAGPARRSDAFAAFEDIDRVSKGEPVPEDGFWLSEETFLMLYEAAEYGSVSLSLESGP